MNVGPLTSNGATTSNNQEMAAILNSYFVTVFSKEDVTNIPTTAEMTYDACLSHSTFTKLEVQEALQSLKPGSAPGPDQISSKLLKDFNEILAIPLAIIFNKSLTTGIVPVDWKKANVTPIFKKGKKSDPANYRPISLTSIPCKVMEKLLKERIMSHLVNNSLLNESQHGFRSNKSTTTNLLEFFEGITKDLDNGDNIDLLYLDFAKAFDKVPHQRLLSKLNSHGIRGHILTWISNWLSGRTQRTTLNGSSSTWKQVLSGVPQGSVLGPLLFLIFINDIDEAAGLVKYLNKFADDTKLGHCVNSDEDHKSLQQTIDNLLKWSKDWSMEFNVGKCHILHLGRSNARHQYTMGSRVIQPADKEKDVGILITDNLKPSQQCVEASRRATTILYQISKSFHYRDSKVLVSLYKQHVRCHLEYASPVWSPWNRVDIEMLEKVQRRLIQLIPNLQGQTYEEKLKEVGLPTLEARRLRQDMITTYKFITGKDDVDYNTWFDLHGSAERITRTSSYPQNIIPKSSRTELRKNFFSNRVVNQWNSLPNYIKDSRSTTTFKNLYDKYTQETV